MAIYNGTVNDDLYTGTSGADTINGNDGSDNLSGVAGADVINGSNGDDILFSQDRDPNATNWFPTDGISTDSGTEVDRLNGGAGDDYIYAGYGDHVDGGAAGSYGNRLYISFQGATAGVTADFRLLWNQPSITVGGGVITNIQNVGYLEGSNFNDFLVAIDTYYPSGANVYGRGGDDHIIADYYSGWGGSGLHGDEGNDVLDGRGGQYGPLLYGDAGDDTIYSSNGFGQANGGEGNDTINGGVTAYGGAGNDTINAETSYYSPYFFGNGGNDSINGSAGNDAALVGGFGADTIRGNSGDDFLYSGIADDVTSFVQGEWSEADTGLEHDQLFGGDQNDRLSIGYGDDADGGIGTDILTISLAGATSSVTLSTAGLISGGTVAFGGGTITGIERIGTIFGSNFADTVTIANQATTATVRGGGGDDTLTLGSGGGALYGDAGNDDLRGGAATDSLFGGTGDDLYLVQNVSDQVFENFNEGTDTVRASLGSYTLGAYFENLTFVGVGAFTGNGNALANIIAGGSGNDTLNGLAGNDSLDGGAGADAMAGGGDDDSYVVDNVGDAITEAANQGTDTVRTTLASYSLTANVERLFYTGAGAFAGTGNDLANIIDTRVASGNDTLRGLAGADALYAGAGNDSLDGGTGIDTMHGGLDDDTYIVDDAGDQPVEAAGEGNDTVRSIAASYTLGANVETLILANGAANGTGNALDNVLIGNGGHNILDGGAGVDRMEGGLGDDTYRVDNANDLIVETGMGIDKAISSVSYTLRAGVSVETLTTDNDAGTVAINFKGNELANRIVGNAAANTLNGGAGNDRLEGLDGSDTLWGDAGTDLLMGGNGNDLYVVTDLGDTIVETATGGSDRVSLSLTGGGVYTLANYVETLVVAGSAIEAHGNGQDNRIVNTGTGNSMFGEGGNDLLNGATVGDLLHGGAGNDRIEGGAGNDTLWGDAGNDVFVFASGTGTDEVVDFVRGSDKIDLTACGVSSFAQLQGLLSQSGANALIDLSGGNSITLDNIVGSALAASDFIFAPSPPAAAILTGDFLTAGGPAMLHLADF